MTHQLRTKNYLWRKNPTYFHIFLSVVGEKSTQWKQIGYKLLERNLCTRQRKMNYVTQEYKKNFT